MFSPLELVTRIGDKAGSIGALVSAMGCAMCFPAIASLGAAIGMGFLSQWEGVFINTLLPLFAVLALAMNILGSVQLAPFWFYSLYTLGSSTGGVHTLLIRVGTWFLLRINAVMMKLVPLNFLRGIKYVNE